MTCRVSFSDLTTDYRRFTVLSNLRSLKSLTDYLVFEVPDRRGYIDITGTVEQLVRKSGVREGLCLVKD